MEDLKKYEKPHLARINEAVKHQDIGGKYIVIERYGTMAYALDMPFDQMTIGLYNFVNRYNMLEAKEDTKLYYGHVGTLGYFVAEDELLEEPKEVEWSEACEYLQ